MGVEIKQLYLTAGGTDLVLFVDTPNGDNIAKFALALGSQGNVHTRTARAWTEAEYLEDRLRIALNSIAAATLVAECEGRHDSLYGQQSHSVDGTRSVLDSIGKEPARRIGKLAPVRR